MKISVIGSGSFGTALSILLANKGFDVTIYGRNSAQIAMMKATRGNHRYLPGIILPDELKMTDDLSEALGEAELAVLAVPAQNLRAVLEEISGIRNSIPMVNVAKGIEKGTLKRMSEIVSEYFAESPFACLSGPSHAEEVARNLPTTVCSASSGFSLCLPDFVLWRCCTHPIPSPGPSAPPSSGSTIDIRTG